MLACHDISALGLENWLMLHIHWTWWPWPSLMNWHSLPKPPHQHSLLTARKLSRLPRISMHYKYHPTEITPFVCWQLSWQKWKPNQLCSISFIYIQPIIMWTFLPLFNCSTAAAAILHATSRRGRGQCTWQVHGRIFQGTLESCNQIVGKV